MRPKGHTYAGRASTTGQMTDDAAVRGLVLAVLLGALCVLFVLGGAGWPTPASQPPSYADLDTDYDAYVGQSVQIGGSVVETDPVVAEFEYDTGVFEERTYRLRLEGAPPADVGDDVYLYGELRPDGTVAVDTDRTLVREPWERTYMFGISILAALLVGGRVVNEWRLCRTTLTLVPRERSLYRRWRGETDA